MKTIKMRGNKYFMIELMETEASEYIVKTTALYDGLTVITPNMQDLGTALDIFDTLMLEFEGH